MCPTQRGRGHGEVRSCFSVIPEVRVSADQGFTTEGWSQELSAVGILGAVGC